ncbi:hypothetical protein C6P61_11400 [Malikia spinosa]|uniref:Glycosyl transferase family 1 domain-containing protein n=1 Tax=Malikia spinosa TaxID=86180 RepID=A0A2S9KD54_9BURK|nr:glycosyltransferase family 4 protein [Malikia spinosa]PRD68389.1 hypothetical protein C6P61_11400 [Malikia spinosa]
MQTSKNNIIVIQPALPAYRINFFDKLYEKLDERLKVYYSNSDLGILTSEKSKKKWALEIGKMQTIIPGVFWQKDALTIQLRKNDILIVSGDARCISTILLLVRARIIGLKTIWWGQLWSASTKKHRFFIRLLLMKLAHSIIFYTDKEVAQYLNSYGNKDARPINALNNGIDIKPIKEIRLKYESKNRDKEILFIGRVTAKSNLKILIDALTEPALNNTKLHIIGEGSESENIKQLIIKLNLSDRIFWHGATTDEHNIASIANKCSIFVYPGSVGLSLIHGMAYGLPAVVHNDTTKHMPEISAFIDGLTGMSFIKDSHLDLAKTLKLILFNEKKLNDMSDKSINQVDNFFNTDQMANRFLNSVLHFDKN